MPIPPSQVHFRAFVDEVQATRRQQQQQAGRTEDISVDGATTNGHQQQELTHLHEQLAKGSIPMSQAQARSLRAIQDRYSTYDDGNLQQQDGEQQGTPTAGAYGEDSRAANSLVPAMSASLSAYFTPGGSQGECPYWLHTGDSLRDLNYMM
jgi:hypothetical protein